MRALVASAACFVALYSLLPHKELRFIFHLLCHVLPCLTVRSFALGVKIVSFPPAFDGELGFRVWELMASTRSYLPIPFPTQRKGVMDDNWALLEPR